jgi:hypothetical protein
MPEPDKTDRNYETFCPHFHSISSFPSGQTPLVLIYQPPKLSMQGVQYLKSEQEPVGHELSTPRMEDLNFNGKVAAVLAEWVWD